MSLVNSFTNWSKLEEVWLGDVYPASWYDHLPSEIQDCFQDLTERTQQDLNYIQKKLESLNVVVCRPFYDHIDNYVDQDTQQLIKPEICPRDYYVTIGKTLFAKKLSTDQGPWKSHIDRYVSQGDCVENMLGDKNLTLNGACIVRAGKDLYFDLVYNLSESEIQNKQFVLDYFKEHFAEKFKDYRIHVLFNGGHVDACFSLLKPGIILGNKYFKDYARTFPNWKLFNVAVPEFYKHARWRNPASPGHNGKWWLPNFKYSKSFNNHVIEHAKNWIGDYTETFFEVNCLVIDENNVFIPGENEGVFRELEKLGITAHAMPFRTRTFWDGGLHCITLDIRRQDRCNDYFPERGESSMIIYD